MKQSEEFINFDELAILSLQNEQVIKYEQLTHHLNYQQLLVKRSLRASYRVFRKAVENVEFFLENFGEYRKGTNRRGNYWEMSYETFQHLNKICSRDMRILYAANCGVFLENVVQLHIDFHLPLTNPLMIEKIIEHTRLQ